MRKPRAGRAPLRQDRRTVTERVRLTPAEDRLLVALARTKAAQKSDVLREGLQLVARLEARRKNMHRLIGAASLVGTGEDEVQFAP